MVTASDDMGFLGCRYELLNGNGGEGEGRVKHSVDGSSLDREWSEKSQSNVTDFSKSQKKKSLSDLQMYICILLEK